MNAEQLAAVSRILAMHAEMVGLSLSPPAIAMMAENLSDLEFNAVTQTLRQWGRTNKGFPYPSEVRSKIAPPENPDESALNIANAIISMVPKVGYMGHAEAERRLGEVAWATVRAFGGWKHICETLNYDNEGIIRAQLRQTAHSTINQVKRGDLGKLPEFSDYAPSAMSDRIRKLITGAIDE
jgi:hypothetical protein